MTGLYFFAFIVLCVYTSVFSHLDEDELMTHGRVTAVIAIILVVAAVFIINTATGFSACLATLVVALVGVIACLVSAAYLSASLLKRMLG